MVPSNSAINRVGNVIRTNQKDEEYDKAVNILNIWREAHGDIMSKYYTRCVKLCSKVDKGIIVAQRLKRLPSIIGKLNRFKTMRLSSMHDIAGVRIITKNMDELRNIESCIKKWPNLVKVDDYIDEKPKSSGYRSKHFIFEKNKMFVEIQLRTITQHLWATSVETTDLFRNAHLKEKDDNSYWHNFFCQVSSIFAMAEETKPIPGYEGSSIDKICDLLRENISKNSIDSQIAGFAMLRPVVELEKNRRAHYAVMELNIQQKEASVYEYPEAMYEIAFRKYQELEKAKNTEKQVVLIGLNQIEKIQDAYPNYFVDLTNFVETIKFLLEKSGETQYNTSNE